MKLQLLNQKSSQASSDKMRILASNGNEMIHTRGSHIVIDDAKQAAKTLKSK